MADEIVITTESEPTNDPVVVVTDTGGDNGASATDLDHESRITALEMRMDQMASIDYVDSRMAPVEREVNDVAAIAVDAAETAIVAAEVASETQESEPESEPNKPDEPPASKKSKWFEGWFS